MQSGLSIGQREALQSGTDSKLESVMGGVGTGSGKKASRVIDVEDLVFDDSETISLDGTQSVPTNVSGAGSSPDQSAAAAVGGSYLNNPVAGAAAWLHNQQMPNVLIKHEKVEHRIILYLKAQGKSNREVAQYMGYSDAQISQITRQPWFLADLKELILGNGADLVRKVLEGAALDSVVTLIELRDDVKTPAAVRATVSNSLLDRLLGKPKQEIAVERKESPVQQVQRIDSELEVLEQQEEELRQQLKRFAR